MTTYTSKPMPTAELRAAQARVRARIPAAIRAAIGQKYAIRHTPTEFTRGVITNVEEGYWKIGGKTRQYAQVVFKITMACGDNKTEKVFFCKTLPA